MMRLRSTYIYDSAEPFDPSLLQVDENTLQFEFLQAAREERLTFGFNELPQELWQVLRQCHELHIRWVSEHPYPSIPPFTSKLSPGLHVFFTPSHRDRPADLLCPLLRKLFGDDLKCRNPQESFIAPPVLSDRFASTSSLEFHQLLPSLHDLIIYIQQKICDHSDFNCISRAKLLQYVDTLDVDYDSISHSLTIAPYWAESPSPHGWSEHIVSYGAEKVEVGILGTETPTDAEELSLSGFLTVVGEDTKPSPVLFSFPSRHHPLPADQQQQTYSVSFPPPTGLHPTMKISFPPTTPLVPPSNKPPNSACSLHTYLTLPSTLFADKYQLSTTDPLFLRSHNLVALRSIAGETDLEAPDWVVRKWGSTLLLELATPQSPSSQQSSWDVTIPLHLRYLPPTPGGHRVGDIPWPIVFWACTAEEGSKMNVNPFDRVNLGWDGIFGGRTMFYQLRPELVGNGSSRLVEMMEVPVLDLDVGSAGGGGGSAVVEGGTVLVILLGFAWVCWRLWAVYRQEGLGKAGVGWTMGQRLKSEKKDI